MHGRMILASILAVVVATTAFAGGYWMRMRIDLENGPPAGPAADEVAAAGAQWLAAAGELPERRPDFDFTDQDGVQRRISDYDGKVVVVNFWATWCPPCLHEIPVFVAFQSRYADRGVQFIGVALDESENVREFVRDVGLNYPTAHGQQVAFEIMADFGNRTGGLPFTAFVNRAGDIAFRKVGPVTEKELEGLLQPHL